MWRWRYGVFWGNLEQTAVAKHAENLRRTVALANAHPEWPFELSLIRANIYNISRPRGPHNRPAILSQDLPAACYLQNAMGAFERRGGACVKTVGACCFCSPM